MKLQILKGREISPKHFRLKKSGNLLFHEGPYLSHWVGPDKSNYFMACCQQAESLTRWMIYRVTADQMFDFFAEKISLRDLVLEQTDGFVFMVDVDGNGDWNRVVELPIQKIPASYVPGPASGFDADVFEPYALELKAHLEQQCKVQPKTYKSTHKPAAVAMESHTDYKTPPKE